MLSAPLTSIKGIGPARAELLGRLDLFTLRDLIYYLPRGYEDYSFASPADGLEHGELYALNLTVTSPPRFFRARGINILTAQAEDASAKLNLTWYNQPYRAKTVVAGKSAYFCGRADLSHGRKLVNPAIYDALPGILPVYPLVKGLTQRQLRDAIKAALLCCRDQLTETLPPSLIAEYQLDPLYASLYSVHFPENKQRLESAKYRLAFEDMLNFSILLKHIRRSSREREGIRFDVGGLSAEFTKLLPFELTSSQKRVMEEIASDMSAGVPMNRLLQGDVGSGKTVLSMFAMYAAMKNGYQSALMAPTEILAEQHFRTLKGIFGDKLCLLKGSMKKAEKDEAYRRVASGEAMAVVGTHALIQKGVEFFRLGVVVTDEQHRFGVRQRAVIANKGAAPDVLIMSATPIPRTLALLLFCDLDLSLLTELPPGRKPIKTHIVSQARRDGMYGFLQEQIDAGRQAYVVCPIIDRSESIDAKSASDVYEELCGKLHGEIRLLTGQMSGEKKADISARFHSGEIGVLVSTTVIEVGIDVKNAVIMVIENAERFGLAQLHQLRGRVGRGTEESFCFLLPGTVNDRIMSRLKTMTETQDGYEIAKKDLELRGPGEFLGLKQHGVSEFQAINMAGSMQALKHASEAADRLFELAASDDASSGFVASVIAANMEKLESISIN